MGNGKRPDYRSAIFAILRRFRAGDVLYSASMPAAGPGANLLTDKEKV